MSNLSKTDLITNKNGSIFHLHLHPGQVADKIILVGDPDRVKEVSGFFDTVEVVVENREFVTHTGYFNRSRISVVSTGIGTDNIDIVINELDALVNIDLKQRTILDKHHKLQLIRLGTSGLLNPDISPGSFVRSKISGGLDGVLHFYKDAELINLHELSALFTDHFDWNKNLAVPYFVKASDSLYNLFDAVPYSGITLSTPGFYGPQFRMLRLKPHSDTFFDRVESFRYKEMNILNFEMESSALYALSKALNHDALTICVGIANRMTMQFVDDYKAYVNRLIELVLNTLTEK